MSSPKISVIVPVYNVDKYLSKCLDSLLQQTFKDFEILLINDGSTDSSETICLEYALKDERIKCFSQNNQGVSAARNYGLKNARGSYIAFIDSDDWYLSNALEVMVSEIERHNADVSIINFIKTKTEIVEYITKNITEVVCGAEIIERQYSRNQALYRETVNAVKLALTGNKLYKKEIFHDLFYPVGMMFEDMYISADIIRRLKKVCYSDKSCLFYRQRENSAMSSAFSAKKLDLIKAHEHVAKTLDIINNQEYIMANDCSYLSCLIVNAIKVDDSDLADRDRILLELKFKIKKTIKKHPIYRWPLKYLKRYFLFKVNKNIYKLFSKDFK